MKKLTRAVPARTVISYQCEVCKTKYRRISQAKKCETRILEDRKFRVGEVVEGVSIRFCGNKIYSWQGMIEKIIGPVPSDSDYEVRILGGRQERIHGHVYQYEVGYVCCVCNKYKTILLYAPELRSCN